MGYIDDLIIADRSELPDVVEAPDPCRRRAGIQDSGLHDPFLVVELWCVLTGTKGEEGFDAANEELNKENTSKSTSDPTAHRTVWPDALTARLAGLSDGEVTQLAGERADQAFAREAELQGEDARLLLHRLRDLASRASKEGKAVLSKMGE